MIFIPDQCIGRMGIGMLHFPHTDILVPDQGSAVGVLHDQGVHCAALQRIDRLHIGVKRHQPEVIDPPHFLHSLHGPHGGGLVEGHQHIDLGVLLQHPQGIAVRAGRIRMGLHRGNDLSAAAVRKGVAGTLLPVAVLFDEIEKAHPDVMNILLQILDEGKINDAQGRTVDFSNTVICMTSNAGSSDQTTASLGFNRSEEERNEEKSRKALSQFLRPEFLGRVDEVITFKPLSEETLQGIAALMLDEYKPSMEAKGIAYSYTPAALAALVHKSQGGKFGARDLRRIIRKAVEDPAAEKIIDGTLVSGSTLTVDAENDEIVLK